MKTILCYGDSNTWGFNPEAAGQPLCRFDRNTRWTGLLQKRLGTEYHIVEEGLAGRTTMFDDPSSPGRNGLTWLLPCMQSHQPVDLLVMMLGTNDTKVMFSAPAMEIATGMGRLMQTALNPYNWDSGAPPQILVVSPIFVGEDIEQSWLWGMFDQASVAKSRELARRYRLFAKLHGCHFFDAAEVAGPMRGEGIHLDAGGHGALADAITAKVREILG